MAIEWLFLRLFVSVCICTSKHFARSFRFVRALKDSVIVLLSPDWSCFAGTS